MSSQNSAMRPLVCDKDGEVGRPADALQGKPKRADNAVTSGYVSGYRVIKAVPDALSTTQTDTFTRMQQVHQYMCYHAIASSLTLHCAIRVG